LWTDVQIELRFDRNLGAIQMPRVKNSVTDEKLIAELAAGKSVQDAAAAAGVVERTVYRRLADGAFRARIMEARARAVASASASLLAGMKEATAVLKSLLAHNDPRIQQRAAVSLLEIGAKINKDMELERRVDQLERFLAVQTTQTTRVTT
jgi:hypothetical protein